MSHLRIKCEKVWEVYELDSSWSAEMQGNCFVEAKGERVEDEHVHTGNHPRQHKVPLEVQTAQFSILQWLKQDLFIILKHSKTV